MYRTNEHRNIRHSKIHGQLVGCEAQWALSQYIILTAEATNLIRHKMEYLESAYRHMKGYECAVRIVVGCNSCCIYIAVMFCSTVRNLSPVQYSMLLRNWL